MDSIEFVEQEPGAMSKLYDAIGKASAAFPDLPRTAKGSISRDRTFMYAPFHKVVKCIKAPLAENGVTFLQPLHTQEDGKVSITLLVCGHGAAISSTLKFDQNKDPKVFGADTTYHKRYQLTAFFGLEGDPDADDFDSDVVEAPAKVSKPVPTQSKPAAQPETKVVEKKAEPTVANAPVAKEVAETAKAVAAVDKRPVSEKLTDAMKQLVWGMKDFNAFCLQYPEDFPEFTSAARLSPDKQQRLFDLLVQHKGVVAF